MDLCEYTCKYCCKQLSQRKSLWRHIKTVHKRNSQGEIISDTPRQKFICVLCDKQYLEKRSLEQHINKIHLHQFKDNDYFCRECDFKTKHKPSLIRHNKRLHNGKKTQNKRTEAIVRHYKCSECTASYGQQKHLNYHKRKKHNSGKSNIVFKRKCPLCSYVSMGQDTKDIYHHFEKHHGIHMKFEHHTFNSVNQFDAWRNETEKKTVTIFRKISSYISPFKSKSVHTYQCHRSGVYKPAGLNKRRIKMSGSCKINGYCPASIKATVKDAEVDVLYIPCHVGHRQHLKYIRLTKEERRSIATQLESGKPHEVIIKFIKSSISNSVLSKFHLTNKNDIRNIETSINLHEEAIKYPYDPVSMESLVSELKRLESTALIEYKAQGTVCPKLNMNINDFLLIYMNQAQKKMLQTYGCDCICIDRTYSENNYNFQLYTILVIDDSREGFPVSFMFTNRQDEHVVKIFFESIKHVVGSMKINVFMSDIEESSYAAWLQTMGSAKMRVFCTWHVLKAWKANVCAKIKNKAKQNEIFKILKTLLYEFDITAFQNLLEKTITRFQNDEDLKEFSNYFETYFKCRSTSWACCYRFNAGVNTNMSMENFNRMLKYCYLKGESKYCLDETLCAVLSLLRDKLFDILIKITSGKLVIKLRNLRTAHRRSLTIQSDRITKNEDKWQVLSSTRTDFYTVQKIKNCKSCQLQCLHCESCFHEFVCSCLENSIRNNMCKHIHAVAKYIKMDYDNPEMYSTLIENEIVIEEDLTLTENEIGIEENLTLTENEIGIEENLTLTENEIGIEEDLILTENKIGIEEDLQEFVGGVCTVERDEHLEELKIKCSTEFQELLNSIKSVDEIKYIINEIKRMRSNC